jgi:hypothetical protein
MSGLDLIRRVAEIEFAAIVVQTDLLGAKLRILLIDTSYVDAWASRKLVGRFGFHWERRHLDQSIYRYDNFPDVNWSNISTFPFHFHDGDQHTVVDAPFTPELEQGFREFMQFVKKKLTG